LTLGVLRRQIDASKTMTAAHSYATCIERYFLPSLELVDNMTDIHTFGRQKGSPAAMLKRHYNTLTPNMAAARMV